MQSMIRPDNRRTLVTYVARCHTGIESAIFWVSYTPPLADLAHCTISRDLYPGMPPYVAHTQKEPWYISGRLLSLTTRNQAETFIGKLVRVKYYMTRRMARPPAYKPINCLLD